MIIDYRRSVAAIDDRHQPDQHARPQVMGGPPVPATDPSLPVQMGRSIIGDALRIPMIWCQFGSCIARFSHTEALGEADVKNRAMHEGWRVDALGRLACPLCVQNDAMFMVIYPPVLATSTAGHDDELTISAGQPAELDPLPATDPSAWDSAEPP